MSCMHVTVAREHTPVVLMDRVYGESKQLINQFSIDSISYRVFEYATEEDARADVNGEEVGVAADLDPTVVIFDTLQTAAPWTSQDEEADEQGNKGYNLRFTLPAARRPTGGTWHRVEVWLTPSAGSEEAYALVWLVKTTPLASA